MTAEEDEEADLAILVRENKGLVVDQHEIMGRILRTTVDMGPDMVHQTILREVPALVCKSLDHLDFVEHFLAAPSGLQLGIVDMFYPPMETNLMQSLQEPANLLCFLGVLPDFSSTLVLLGIFMTNGHQYGPEHTAIPLLGSKFGHSCDPNVAYSSEISSDGALEYKLLRPVKAGEIMCFSYLTDLLETPTNERRQLLQQTKEFWCLCDRCMGPDYTRCLPCPVCAQQVPCQYPLGEASKDEQAYWECPKCGIVESGSMLSKEQRYADILQQINQTIEEREDIVSAWAYSPSKLQALVDQCQAQLSPTHHLTIKALRLLFTTATAKAYAHMKQMIVRGLPLENASTFSLFRHSVLTCYRLVLVGECIAVGCTGCSDPDPLKLQPHHEACYDRALAMRHCSDNVLRLPTSWWPPQVLSMTRRYLPLLRSRFGDGVDNIERGIFDVGNNLTCLGCGTYWEAKTGETLLTE